MCRLLHRTLCFLGVHCPEKIFSYSGLDLEGSTDYNLDGDFKCVGSLCTVCLKEWRSDDA